MTLKLPCLLSIYHSIRQENKVKRNLEQPEASVELLIRTNDLSTYKMLVLKIN